MADNDTITDLARHYGVTASQVRRALATAKREGRKLTDAYFLDDLSALPKPLGNEEHAEFAELIVAVENLDMLTALWARFAGTATGERIFAAFQKGQALKLEREKHSKARDRRGRPPAVELEVAADGSDAGLVNWFFWLGFGQDGMTTKRAKGGRPKLTAAAAAKILRTRKARRLKGGATTKNGGYAASADNSGRERARKAIRRLFDEDPPRPTATSSKRRSGAATRAMFEQMAASILGDRETRRAKREKVWRKKQAARKRIANRTTSGLVLDMASSLLLPASTGRRTAANSSTGRAT